MVAERVWCPRKLNVWIGLKGWRITPHDGDSVSRVVNGIAHPQRLLFGGS